MSDRKNIDEKMETLARALDFNLSFIAPESEDVRILKIKDALRDAFDRGRKLEKLGRID